MVCEDFIVCLVGWVVFEGVVGEEYVVDCVFVYWVGFVVVCMYLYFVLFGVFEVGGWFV